MGARSLGLDVSSCQGNHIDWRKVVASGIEWASVKATDGIWGQDPMFALDWLAMGRAGESASLPRCPYAFLHPRFSPESQADHFAEVLDKVGGLREIDLPPMLDFEVDDGRTPLQIEDWLLRVLARTRSNFGRVPLLYVGSYFLDEHLAGRDVHELEAYPLWIPAYLASHKPIGEPRLPKPWKRWTIWQYSGDVGERVPGIDCPVDRDVFNGSIDDLRAFIAATNVSHERQPESFTEGSVTLAASQLEDERAAAEVRAALADSRPPTIPSTPSSKSSQRLRAVAAPIVEKEPKR